MPSAPWGGTALRSITTRRSSAASRTEAGRSWTPAAPAQKISCTFSIAEIKSFSEEIATALSVASGIRAAMFSQVFSARSRLRDANRTAVPCLAKRRLILAPTGPVPPSTKAVAPPSWMWDAAARTAAEAVVLQPPESSITETRTGPKKELRTASKTSSPSKISEPPTKMAVFFSASPPRVNIAP